MKSFVLNIPNQMYPDRMVDMGYRTTRAGVCHGDSVMYGQAVKAHDEKHFDERQAAIRDLLQQEADGGQRIEEKIQSARARIKEKKREKKTGPDDALLLEISAYFDSIALAQAPHAYEDVFNKKLTQENYRNYLPFVASKKIETEQSDQKSLDADTTLLYEVGIFNRQQFEEYFRDLREILREAHEKHGEVVDDLPFIVGSFGGHHAIAFHYNYLKDNWTYRDPNKIKLEIDTNEIASMMMRSIFEPNHVGIDIFLDVTPEQNKQLPHLRQALAKFQEKHARMLEEMTKIQTDGSFTLLNYAFRYKNEKTLQLLRALNKEKPLKERGIDVNFRDKNTGQTAAHFVTDNDDIESFKILVELGIDVTTPDDSTRTPLQYALYKEADELAMAIATQEAKMWSVEKGMYIDTNKATALHHAILRGRPQVVEHVLTLLEKQDGGDDWVAKQLNIKNIKGKTAIDCAFYANNEEIALALTKRLLRCANREKKVELFQKAMQQGFIKVCDMIVTSLKDESKVDEKLLFLQLASGSIRDDFDPLTTIMDLIKKIEKSNDSREDHYSDYFYKDFLAYDHDQHIWKKDLRAHNDLFIAEMMKRHASCFQKKENREVFNKFICESYSQHPGIYRELLNQCESPAECNSYLGTEYKYNGDKVSTRTMWWAIVFKQEDIAIDLIKLGVDPSKEWNNRSFLEYAIVYNLKKLSQTIIDKLLQSQITTSSADSDLAMKKSQLAKGYLHPFKSSYSYYRHGSHESPFEIAIREGDIEHVKQLYKFMESACTLEDKQDIFVFACQNSNITIVRGLLDLLCPNKKDIDKVTAKYFANLSSQLSSIRWSEKPHDKKLELFQILFEMVKEQHVPLTLKEKIEIFELAKSYDMKLAIDFILSSFKSSAELREFITSGRLLTNISEIDLLVKFLNAFRDDKKALKELLYKEQYSLLEEAIRNNQYAKAHLFVDFLLDSLAEHEKQNVFSWAVKYEMGSIANKILASISEDREKTFLQIGGKEYKQLCPSSNIGKLRSEFIFHQTLLDYFKERKNAETLSHFRTAVLFGDAVKVNQLLSTLPKDELTFYLNHRDQEGRTVLSDALLNGDEAMALNLLRAGAKNVMDLRFSTPFSQAVWKGAYPVVAEMLSSSTEDLITVDIMTNALSQKHDDIGALFVKHGCKNYYVTKNPGKDYEEYNTTLLHEAVGEDMEKTALALASHADFYWNIPDTKHRKTPTHLAAVGGNPTILRKAIEAKADFFIADKNDRSAADCLVLLKRYGILVELLESTNEKKSISALQPSDVDKIKEEFIQQIERQALQNPDLALSRMIQVCENQNLLASILFGKALSSGTIFSQSKSEAILSEFKQIKTRLETKVQTKPEPGFGVL
ncbi:MAG: ankyrin repeat domain-containing protein [Gammaproteobacteria bacterium]